MKRRNQTASTLPVYLGSMTEFKASFFRIRERDPANLFILQGKIPVRCASFKDWRDWIVWHPAERLVAQTNVGQFCVATVFHGDSRGWVNQCPRLVFKTEVFVDDRRQSWLDDLPCRYSTWIAAQRGHARVLQIVKRELAAKLPSGSPLMGSQSSQGERGRQSPRRQLVQLCQDNNLTVHHHRGQVFFRFQGSTGYSLKDAIVFVEGYSDGYQDAMHDEMG